MNLPRMSPGPGASGTFRRAGAVRVHHRADGRRRA